MLITGGSYDLIAFNPRGTGQTLPFNCFDSDQERQIVDALSPTGLGGSDAALGDVWAAKTALAQTCFDHAKDVGDLIGTAFVARDM